MRTQELLSPVQTKAASIAKQIVLTAAKTYVPEDLDRAVEKMIMQFAANMREAAKTELRFQRMEKIPPKTGI